MNTETPMNSRTINAEEDPICYWCPCWILRIAIKTHLKPKSSQLQKSKTNHNHNNNNQYKKKSKFKCRTLFSDFNLSFLNTRFLSVKPSEAIDEKPIQKLKMEMKLEFVINLNVNLNLRGCLLEKQHHLKNIDYRLFLI